MKPYGQPGKAMEKLKNIFTKKRERQRTNYTLKVEAAAEEWEKKARATARRWRVLEEIKENLKKLKCSSCGRSLSP